MNKINRFIIENSYRILNQFLRFSQWLLFTRLNDQKPSRILIFRTGSIGDNVCALPAIDVIRKNFPDAELHVLTNAGASNLVSIENLIDNSVIDKVINYLNFSKKDLFRLLKQNKYDLFIELPQYDVSIVTLLRNMVVVKLLGVRHAFGWKLCQLFFLKKYQEKNTNFQNERDRLLEILKENKLNISSVRFPLGITKTNKQKVEDLFYTYQIKDPTKTIGIVTGAKRHRNQWPIEHFKEVVDHFIEQGYTAILFGGPEDVPKANEFRKHKQIINFCGALFPLETAEAMKRCSLVITNDTGPMHLAYAVGTPVVSLFSSRDFPGKWYPPADGINVAFRSKDISCSLCFKQTCANNICMRQISPLSVKYEAEKLLQKHSKQPAIFHP